MYDFIKCVRICFYLFPIGLFFQGGVAILKFTKTCLQIIHTSNICVWFGLNVWNDIQEECVCLYFP